MLQLTDAHNRSQNVARSVEPAELVTRLHEYLYSTISVDMIAEQTVSQQVHGYLEIYKSWQASLPER